MKTMTMAKIKMTVPVPMYMVGSSVLCGSVSEQAELTIHSERLEMTGGLRWPRDDRRRHPSIGFGRRDQAIEPGRGPKEREETGQHRWRAPEADVHGWPLGRDSIRSVSPNTSST